MAVAISARRFIKSDASVVYSLVLVEILAGTINSDRARSSQVFCAVVKFGRAVS